MRGKASARTAERDKEQAILRNPRADTAETTRGAAGNGLQEDCDGAARSGRVSGPGLSRRLRRKSGTASKTGGSGLPQQGNIQQAVFRHLYPFRTKDECRKDAANTSENPTGCKMLSRGPPNEIHVRSEISDGGVCHSPSAGEQRGDPDQSSHWNFSSAVPLVQPPRRETRSASALTTVLR